MNKQKKIKIKNLEQRIGNLIYTIKTTPKGIKNAKLIGQLGRYAIEYKELAGKSYRVKGGSW